MAKNEIETKRIGRNRNASKSKGRGSRNSSRGRTSRNEEAVMKESEVKAQDLKNDPNWYFTSPEIATQAGQLSFQDFLGTTSTLGTYKCPTIMTLHLNPSPGNTYPGALIPQGQKSGFNMSMTRLFNRLSMKSGRNMAYAPQDVGACILGIGELLSMVSYMRRLFGITKWWNVRNRMVPKQIIKAMGIDPDDFFKYFSDYRMRANTLILACNQIPIITNSGYLRKCASIYDNIYVDVDAGMAQYYIMVPYSTWYLDESSNPNGTVCATLPVCDLDTPNTLGGNAVRVQTFGNFLDNVFSPMVARMLQSSTLNLVYADILNLNKTEDLALATIDVISEDYAVVPVHDPMTLKQIHNMVAMGFPDDASGGTNFTPGNDVIPDPNTNSMQYSPAFHLPVNRSYGNVDPLQELGDRRIIDTDNSNPPIEEKIEITRYVATHSNTRVTVGTDNYSIWDTVPDHYAVCFILYQNDISGTITPIEDRGYAFISDFTGTTQIPTQQQMALIETFDWHPMIYHYDISGATTHVDWVAADLNSYTTVDPRYLIRLNSIIYMDLFEIR